MSTQSGIGAFETPLYTTCNGWNVLDSPALLNGRNQATPLLALASMNYCTATRANSFPPVSRPCKAKLATNTKAACYKLAWFMLSSSFKANYEAC